MEKITYIGIFIIGLLPGIIFVLISLLSFFHKTNEKIEGQIIGGNDFPTVIFLTKTNLSFSPSWFGVSFLTLGIIFYIIGIISMIGK